MSSGKARTRVNCNSPLKSFAAVHRQEAKRHRFSFAIFLFFFCMLFALPVALYSQSTQATILGTIKDPAGAVVAQAHILVTDTDKGIATNYTTDQQGNYQALNLTPGTYTVEASKEGFQIQTVRGLTLTARQELRVDISFAIAGSQQTVAVDAGARGAIETETAAISSTLDSQNVMSLPANFRASGSTSPLSVIQVLPGVQPDTGPGTTAPTANGTPNVNFSVQGGQPFQTEASVDGISTQNLSKNTPLSDAFPSAESVAEIRVDGVSSNAEFGQAGEITTITKSGTNQLHGALFWYFQNRALDAAAFGSPINPATGEAEKPEKIGNDFGASAGGPLVIPHLYNGHDKTFFFGTYEGFRFPRQSTIQDLVPTPLMLQGNFSQELAPGQLLNPFTGQPYPNNTIPSINFAARPFLGFFPTPNVGNYTSLAAAEAGTGYNYAANLSTSYESDQFDARIDQHFNQKLQAFARFTFKDLTLLSPQSLKVPSVTDFDSYRILASSLLYSFTPNLLNEFRFGFTFENNGARNFINGGPYTNAAAFDAVGPTYPVNGVTDLDFSNLTSLEAGFINSPFLSHLGQYTDNLTWVKAKHTLKAGVDIRAIQSESQLGGFGLTNMTNFAFNGQITGNQFADFLAGAPEQTQYFTLVPENDGKSIYYGAYAQDEWKALPNLIVSFGLRYEYHPSYHDAKGAIGNFDPSTPQTGAVVYPDGFQNELAAPFLASFDACGYGPPSTAYAGCTPVLSNSQDHIPNSLRKSVKDRFLPRVGLAWRPFNDEKTAVRAGFGVYNTTLLGQIFFSLTDTLQAAQLFYQNAVTPTGLAYSWPETTPTSGSGAPIYGASAFGTSLGINWKDPYSMQWDLSVDHELKNGFGTHISYIGMKTDQLVWAPSYNEMSYSSTTPAEQRPLSDRPFPNWGDLYTRLTGAQASYESLQMEANHRFKHGYTFESAYTWAKNLADNQGPTPTAFASENGSNINGLSSYLYDRKIDFGNVYGTRRQRWINTGVLDVPVGRGREFGTNMSRLGESLVGGWQLSSIFLLQTGPYLSAYIPSNDADPSGTGSGVLMGANQLPDVVGKIVPAHRSRTQWVNPDAFACPSNTGYSATSYAGNPCGVGVTSNPIGRFGTESEGDVEGPGTVNLSAGLSKRIEISERVHLRMEGTFTNVLNHTNLNDPILDITNPGFGQITSTRGSDFGGNRTGQVSMRMEF
jgi:hypothetical protein